MKKILSFLILCGSTLTIYGQTWNGTNPLWTMSSVGIGTSNISAPLTVYGISQFYPHAAGGGDLRSLLLNSTFMNATFINNDYPLLLTTGGGNQPLILDAPRIGIGTVNPQYKLDVLGTVRAREVRVDLSGADFVFEENYKLMALKEVEEFVIERKHLPDIASAKEMEKNGVDLGDLNSKLLQKIEELTLYLIEQSKEIRNMKEEIRILKIK